MAAPYSSYNAPAHYDYDDRTTDNHTLSSYASDYSDEEDQTSSESRRSLVAQYIDGLDPAADPPSKEDQQYFANPHALPVLKIRRHTPGSSDPLSHNSLSSLEGPPVVHTPSLSNVKVTIQRHPIESEQQVIKPVPYPVPVYVNPPFPQYLANPPFPQYPANPPFPQYPVNSPFQYVQPMPPIQLVQPVQPIQLVQPTELAAPVKEVVKPQSPRKPTASSETPSNLTSSADVFIAESFQLPPSRNKVRNITPRKPIRTEPIAPAPSIIKQRKAVPNQHVNDTYDTYDDNYELSNNYTIPKKTISYRPTADMTTRELENDQLRNSRQPDSVRLPKNQIITYRKT